MRETFRRVVFLLLASITLLPHLAPADGMLYSGRDRLALSPLLPDEQVAAIVHGNHTQRMVIALRFRVKEQDKAVWILPVPGTPERIKMDVVDSFPRFRGRNPRSDAALLCSMLFSLVRATQGWPLLLDIIGLNLRFKGRPAVAVYSEIEKWGIHAETITAKSMEDLTAYLREKNAGIDVEHLRSFQSYLSDQYVLVVSWISSEQELLSQFPEYEKQRSPGADRQPGIYVEFPAERASYPLRATSAYGDEVVSVRLFLVGYMRPDTPAALAGSVETAFYDQRGALENAPKAFSEGLPPGPFPYTAVSIRSSARSFTDDLWFSPAKEPAAYRFAHAFESLGGWLLLLLVMLIFAILSYLAAGLAGLWRGGQWRAHASLGFWNLLTLGGMWIAIRRAGKRGENLPKKGFLGAFTWIFVYLTVLLQFVLSVILRGEDLAALPLLIWITVGIPIAMYLLVRLLYFLSALAFKRG